MELRNLAKGTQRNYLLSVIGATRYYQKAPDKLSKEMMLLISGYEKLMEEESFARESIGIREKIVLPLLIIQQYALQKVSLNTNNKELYEKIITRSLYGNINASRDSV